MNIQEIFNQLNLTDNDLNGGTLAVHSPRDGALIAMVHKDSAGTAENKIASSVT
ncbi:hypothetical protein MNBD_ALPHA01-1611, partial [hydrothermal vent metagenome]